MDPTDFKSSSLPFSITFKTNITIRHQVARSGLIFCDVGKSYSTVKEPHWLNQGLVCAILKRNGTCLGTLEAWHDITGSVLLGQVNGTWNVAPSNLFRIGGESSANQQLLARHAEVRKWAGFEPSTTFFKYVQTQLLECLRLSESSFVPIRITSRHTCFRRGLTTCCHCLTSKAPLCCLLHPTQQMMLAADYIHFSSYLHITVVKCM